MNPDNQSLESCTDVEILIGNESYKTPTPPSADSCVTETVSCVRDEDPILLGDFEMDCYREHPHLTLALIKPDGMKYLDQIEKRIRAEGFTIVRSRLVHLSPEQVSNFYYEHYGRPYFPLLVARACEGPVQVYVLAGHDAVATWKFICGPTNVDEAKKLWPDSIRAIYGTPGKDYKNVCHASATEEKAREEIRFFFPAMKLDNNFQSESYVDDYIQERVNPTLLEGLIQLCKNKPLDPISWLGGWLLKHNPNKPKMEDPVALVPT